MRVCPSIGAGLRPTALAPATPQLSIYDSVAWSFRGSQVLQLGHCFLSLPLSFVIQLQTVLQGANYTNLELHQAHATCPLVEDPRLSPSEAGP